MLGAVDCDLVGLVDVENFAKMFAPGEQRFEQEMVSSRLCES